MSAADQAKFTNVFGENMFVGYVLKREGSGWHIDGVLAEDPPVYVVELYDAENNGLFAISSNDTKLPGVTYREFKRKAEEILGGQNYQYEEGNDHIIMTYQKDGVTYQTEIVPKSDGADASYVKNYHVYPAQGKFAYRTVTADTYYLCRLKMTTRQVGTDLWIEKKVAGGAADPKEHFTFVLTKTSLAGTSYSVSYEGIAENDGAGHQETLTFDGNGVARLSLKNGEKARILQMPSGDVQIKEENGDYVTKVTVNGISEKYSDASGIKIQLSREDRIGFYKPVRCTATDRCRTAKCAILADGRNCTGRTAGQQNHRQEKKRQKEKVFLERQSRKDGQGKIKKTSKIRFFQSGIPYHFCICYRMGHIWIYPGVWFSNETGSM